MKKFLVTILALIYLASSVGATVHLHYCMGKLVNRSLGHTKQHTTSCPYCGMGKSAADKHCVKASKGCCKDDQKQVKLKDDQKLSETDFKVAKISDELIYPVFPGYSLAGISSMTEEYPVTHAPPQIALFSLFILHCVYRI